MGDCMAIKALKCPNCGGIIEQFDETMKKGFCPYCDSIILDVHEKQTEFIQFMNKFQVEGISTVDNLLARAQKFLDAGDFVKSIEYANKVLDLDINNLKANKILEESQIITINGAEIRLSEIKEIINRYKISKADSIKELRLASGLGLVEAKFFLENAILYKDISLTEIMSILSKIKTKSKNFFVLKDF